jgi:ribosomal protein L25 (general stress protein Ctc)
VGFLKINVFFILFIFLFFNCAYTKSGNTNSNRDIIIKVIYGNVSLNISGHISEDIYYFYPDSYDGKGNKITHAGETPAVVQGKETINQNIILYENQEFKYTLIITEAVIVNVKSIDGNDAKLLVSEYGKNKEYIINGKNNLGQFISFKN